MLRDGTSLYRILCYVYQLLFADCSLRHFNIVRYISKLADWCPCCVRGYVLISNFICLRTCLIFDCRLRHCYTSHLVNNLQDWCPCKCPFGCFAGSNNCYGYTRCDTSSQNGHAKFHASVIIIFGFLLS